MLMGLGTLPGMEYSFSTFLPTTGLEAIRPMVYGWQGCRNTSSAVPASTMRPEYMTTTKSAISAMTPRSCVMNMMEELILSFRLRSRSRICAWIVTSRAVVGSSAMMMRGLQARAMAIMTL